jgi:DNA-binding transcriptional LysR family regulator
MIRKIELVTLLQVLATAEQGSFHKAGLLFGVPASTISRRVRTLETQMGIKLFSRHTHGIRRTAVADGFLGQIRRVLDDLDLILVNASNTKRGHTGGLRIGLYVSPWRGHLRAVLSAFKHRFPNITLEYTELERTELMNRLNAGAIDVAIVPNHVHHSGYEVVALWREKVLVALPRSHQLADKRSVTWDDLRKEQIMLGRDTGPDLRDYLMVKLKASGHLPTIHHHNVGRDFSLSLVGLERDITLLYEADAAARCSEVVYREVTNGHGPSLVPYFACSLADNDNPALRNFLNLLREARCHHERYPPDLFA